ncbi:MAG: glycosyltransferase family 9 protein [Chthoniobacteraceae bacterium]
MSRAMSMADIKSVLVVKPSSLGDIVHTLPSVHLLKQTWPHLKIQWIVNTEWAPLLTGNPDLDRVFIFPRKNFRRLPDLYKLRDWLWEVSRIKPDLALDFQGLMRSALIAKISGARSVHCLADAEVTPRFLSHRVVPAIRSEEHAVTRYLKLVADLGVDVNVPLEFPLPTGEKPLGAELPERYLLVHPFSRGENKSLSRESLERMFQLLAPIPIVLAGRAEKDFQVPRGCVNLLNRTSLPELIWLIRHAQFTVSVDSGPMHIAAAITGRLLGIHNWTNPLLVGPYNPEAWVWKNGGLLQMRDVTLENVSGSRGFGMEDVEKVAGFLKEQFSASAS